MEPSVHDRFARRVFADPAVMRELLRSGLPTEVAARLDLAGLRREPGTLLDAELREKVAFFADSPTKRSARDPGTPRCGRSRSSS